MEYESEKGKVYTPLQAKRKAESYCAYQERAQQEVRDKLYSWGLHSADVEQVISELISDNFLNEERFAKAFVSGKFRIKAWGKIKIIQHLKAKRVSKPLIQIALREIDLDEYKDKLEELIKKKIDKPISSLNLNEKAKLIRYLQSKGYESDLIFSKFKE
ncbi:RecX family transcriptional regulator [Sphingobacterium sp. DK4209]|uniref:Regulatory protein RecX n=1 Tax=Sphingobacterium zhuxiongii TaxID=2662364 RepID=A0A5Q0QC21_9SPHI|nr:MULTISPECIES: regulatory protein RecX [unclassified Sphingobacterium]MVZ67237.1 RecX family transcriptional regulator [Sphingobacterium sp. DK4209]QGA26739.1 RecX family transcriptional regulator [Sphingobacterium sp. dk4302]